MDGHTYVEYAQKKTEDYEEDEIPLPPPPRAESMDLGALVSPTQAMTQEAALALAPAQAFSPAVVAALAGSIAVPANIGGELEDQAEERSVARRRSRSPRTTI